MFTGLIEELGTIKDINISGESGSITIQASKVLEETVIGDSIAVNGVCLTVTRLMDGCFSADVMAETMRRTALSIVKRGDKVNLERAMAANGRFGGHIVSGHIDGTGRIEEYKREGNAVWVKIGADKAILDYIVEKGSIAIDGISLTVAVITDSYFKVSIIPHTAGETTLLLKKTGDPVNLENDIVGKYVKKFISSAYMPDATGGSVKGSGLTMDMLADFMS